MKKAFKKKTARENAVRKDTVEKQHDSALSQKAFMYRPQNVAYYLAAFVSLVTFLIYLSSLQHEFVNYDDSLYIYENPYIRSFDVTFIKWAFSTFYAGNWHPLTWISHALDYAIWGLNPLGHHLSNNILHAVNTFLVVILAARLIEIGRRSANASHRSPFTFLFSPFTLIAAGVTGLLFGLHPLHVESVAWVAERKDLLCALLFLLSIMLYVKYVVVIDNDEVQKKSSPRFLNKWYFLAFGFFVLALLSKPMAVSLPFVLLMLDWYPFKRIPSVKLLMSAWFEKAPFIVIACISSILTVLAQSAAGAMGTPPPLSIRMLVAAKSLIAYLYKMMAPLNLIPVYFYPMDMAHYFSLAYGLAVVLVAGITVTCIIAAKKEKLWLTVWCCYVITLLPVLGIVQVGIQSMADRYTYLPSLGPFLLAGLGAAWVSTKLLMEIKLGMISKLFIAVAALTVFIFMSYVTIHQIGLWKNGIVLWSYVIKKEPEKVPIAYVNRGALFYQAGQLDMAMADFDKAIGLSPGNLRVFLNWSYYSEAYMRRGLVFEKMGQLDKAITDFKEACHLGNEEGCRELQILLR